MRGFRQLLSGVAPWILLAIVAGTGVGCSGESQPEVAGHASSPADADPPGAGGRAAVDVGGRAPTHSEGAPSIIILYPETPSDVPIPTEPAVMDQLGRDFIPRQLLVRLGQPVLFKNSEDDLHTVHVKDPDGTSLLNVAMPIRGGLHETLLDEAGDYAVSCEAHQEMSATIFVLTTPYAAIADRDGIFSIPDVAFGRYTLILRRGEERSEQLVEITADQDPLQLAFPPRS